MGHFAKSLEAAVNLLARKREQTFRTKALYGKSTHHAAVKHGALQDVCIELLLRGNVSQEAAGECITRARGVAHFIQRQRRCVKRMAAKTECPLLKKDGRAIFAVLDHQRFGAESKNFVGRAQQIVVFGKLAGLTIINDHDVNIADGMCQLLRRGFNPERMRIQAHKFRAAYLIAHLALQLRINITQKDVFRIAVAGGNLGLKFLEDVHLQIKQLAIVGILSVLARPVEGLTSGMLDARDINPMFMENIFMLLAEVLAHNCNYAYLGKVTRRKREEGRRPAQAGANFAVRTLDVIESD